MAKTVGIYFGETNFVVAHKDSTVKIIATGPNNEVICRSCVAIDHNGDFVVGNAPYKRWKMYAPNIIVGVRRLLGKNFSDTEVKKMKNDKDMYPFGISKKSGGTDESVSIVLKGKEYSPEQISGQILRQLKEDASIKLNDEVTHAVITVPAYFNEKQKSATRKAAELAGLKVQRLLSEPIAATISYGANKMSEDENKIFLVYDFGSKTLDLSILVASGGRFIESGEVSKRLGGDDIDRLLSEYVITETGKEHGFDLHELIESLPGRKKYAFQGEFKKEVEDAKKTLCQSESATVQIFDILETEDGDPVDIDVTITRDKFESLIRPLVQRTIDLIDELLKETAYPIDIIDNILLVGGSSCIPLVRKMLTEKYDKEKILFSEKPMLAKAVGAAILSQSMGTEFECPHCYKSIPVGSDECTYCNYSFIKIEESENATTQIFFTKHQYYIQTKQDEQNGTYTLIIDENVVLPNEVNGKFYTHVDNQKIIAVKLFSDAENGTKEKIGTAYLLLSENLPVHSELQFTFRLTEDETMNVKVRVASTGKIYNVTIGRGDLDTHCFETIQKSIDNVMGDSNILENQKINFLNDIQEIIERINAKTISSENYEWQKIIDQITNITQRAKIKKVKSTIQFFKDLDGISLDELFEVSIN